MSDYEGILEDICVERDAQTKKWGIQRHDFPVWMVVLMEEVGELSKEVLEYRNWFAHVVPNHDNIERCENSDREFLALMRLEAIQVAAVAVAMVEHIDELLYPDPGEEGHEEGSEPEYPDGMFDAHVFDYEGGAQA